VHPILPQQSSQLPDVVRRRNDLRRRSAGGAILVQNGRGGLAPEIARWRPAVTALLVQSVLNSHHIGWAAFMRILVLRAFGYISFGQYSELWLHTPGSDCEPSVAAVEFYLCIVAHRARRGLWPMLDGG
jgi:hypothetical protein